MPKSSLTVLLLLAWLTLQSPSLRGQDCTMIYPPVGKIDAEYTRLDRELGPLGCPLALEEGVIDRTGAFQEFARGQIVWSPESGHRDAVLAAYFKPACEGEIPAEPSNGPGTPEPTQCIVFRWKDLPESDVFIIRLADQEDAGIVPEERREGQIDVIVEDREIDPEDPEDKGFDPRKRVVTLIGDEPLTRTSGAIAVRVNRFQAGRYKFTIKGCSRGSGFLGIGTDTECPHPWSNTAYVDYEFLNLRHMLNRPPAGMGWQYQLNERRNAALAFACRRADGLETEEPGGLGMTAMALLASKPPLLFVPPGTLRPFTCRRELDNLTKLDTVENLAALNAGDDILSVVGGDCDAGLGPVPGDPGAWALKNECVVALALRGLKKTKEVGTDTELDEEEAIIALSVIAGALGGLVAPIGVIGAAVGYLLGEELAECAGTRGDYDFELQWLVRLMLVHGPIGIHDSDGKIDETTWKHLLSLLTERGRGTFDRTVLFCGLPVAPETENHAWMIESARYLTNEILTRDAIRRGGSPDPAFDNEQNGQERLILRQLQKVLIEDFYEFNSRPYQRLTVQAIRNLYELGDAEGNQQRVARAAEVVLDYLSARYALSSNGLRRVANFRRQEHRERFGTMFQTLGDEEMSRMALLAGSSLPLAEQRFGRVHPWQVGTMVFHATGRRYDVPELVRDYMVRGVDHSREQDVLQRFRSSAGADESGLEVHFSTSRFMLSAGGVRAASRLNAVEDIFGAEQGSPLPTVLLLTNAGRGWQEMVRFSGTPDPDQRINTCVGPNFACGIDPVVPSTVPEACIDRSGNWTFINFNKSSSECARPYGVHVALWSAECTEEECAFGGSTWGLMEVQEAPIPTARGGSPHRLAQEVAAFLRFKNRVRTNNAPFEPQWSQANTSSLYRTTKGHVIQFTAGPVDNQEWAISHINGSPTPRVRDWPVASGTVMNALPDQPCIEFDNEFRGKRLVLDLRDLGKDPRSWKCEVPIGRMSSCRMPDPCP
jgi:hypothetical protein